MRKALYALLGVIGLLMILIVVLGFIDGTIRA